jgi:hypothetical protein
MLDSSWIAYIGVITGTIGSLTGIGALLVAIQANRKSASAKASDLRIALGKSIIEVENDLAVMAVFIKEVDNARRRVAALEGFDSKSTEDWTRNANFYENFEKKARETVLELLKGMNKRSLLELENDIIDMHRARTDLKAVETIFTRAKKRYDETSRSAEGR